MTVRNAGSMNNYGSTWQHKGYSGHGSVTGLLDCHRGRPAIIAGNAATVFDDVHAASLRLQSPAILAVNDIGMYLPRVDHWVSLHTTKLAYWHAIRQDRSTMAPGNLGYQIHAPAEASWVTAPWLGLTPLFSLSGYFAMQLAWLMGYNPIVLCGCPGDRTPRFFDAQSRADFDYQTDGVVQQLQEEMTRVPELKKIVRSQSGWTKAFFGSLDGGV